MDSPQFQKFWRTSKRTIDCSGKTLVMAILNVTPDSFSDGGRFTTKEKALRQVEKFIRVGADIIDIGGESTRPGSIRVSSEEEINRVHGIIEEIVSRFDIPVSIDTSKAEVAEAAVSAGAEIINDVSGLRFDERIAQVASKCSAGLILMHSRGGFAEIHIQEAVSDIYREVLDGLDRSISAAKKYGVTDEQICVDVGIGFSKTFGQNKELIAILDRVSRNYEKYPMLIGTSRKSFIGKILDNLPADGRISGTIATNVLAVWNGANIVRVHDVKPIAEALRVVDEIRKEL